MISSETAKRCYINGLKSGYPKCCIEQFILDCDNDVYPALDRLSLDGYVPCLSCQAKILEDIDKRVFELLNTKDTSL